MRQFKSLLACATVVAGLAGCTTTGTSTVAVSGRTLTIYTSLPSSASTPQAQDVLRAEELAFKQSSKSVSKFAIKLIELTRSPSDNARTAIQDTSAIAYLGEGQPGASADSMGINEDQDLLQVSPTDTALELTQSTPAVPGAPDSYYEQFSTYGRTFARVVPSGAAEARAQVQEMRSLLVRKLYVADDGSAYGKAIAHAVRQDAGSSISVATGAPTATAFSSSGADALFFGASPQSASSAATLFTRVASADSRAKLFVPSALSDTAFAGSLGAVRANVYVSEPGFISKNLPSLAEQQFVKPFESTYHRPPATAAIFGYEAMSAVLAVLHEAGSKANNRSTVVHDFFSIKNRSSVLGTYSIDSRGDTSIAPFVFSRVAKGVLVPYRFVQLSP